MLPHPPSSALATRGRRARRSAWLAVPAALLVVVAACGGDEPTADAVAGTSPAPADAATATTGAVTATTPGTAGSGSAEGSAATTSMAPPAVEGQPVEILRFTAPLVGGGTFDANTATERPIAFWFWAPT